MTPLPPFHALAEPSAIFEPARAAAIGALERLNSRVSIADLTGHVARSVSIVSVRPILPAVAVSTQPAGLVVVEPVNIFDIAPVASGAGPVLHPVPVVDRAQDRIQSRLNALFARSQDLPRAGRAGMVSSLLSRSSFLTNPLTVPRARVAPWAGGADPGSATRLIARGFPRRQGRAWVSSSVAGVGIRFWPGRQMSSLRLGRQVELAWSCYLRPRCVFRPPCFRLRSDFVFRLRLPRSAFFLSAGLADWLQLTSCFSQDFGSSFLSPALLIGPVPSLCSAPTLGIVDSHDLTSFSLGF